MQFDLLHKEKLSAMDHHTAPDSGDPEKAPNAFKTISEVAELLDVPQHVLRFWESRFPQIKPLKLRGGRRYYRPQDIEVLTTIKHLLYKEGYTIKGAKKAFSHAKQEEKNTSEHELHIDDGLVALEVDFADNVSDPKELLDELTNMRDMLAPFMLPQGRSD